MPQADLPPIADSTWRWFVRSAEDLLPRPDGFHHVPVDDDQFGAIDVLFIVEQGEVVAVAYWYIDGTWESGPGSVNLMVAPEHRGWGYGKMLVKYLLGFGMDPERSRYTDAGVVLLRKVQS